jgi:hypothetical protein
MAYPYDGNIGKDSKYEVPKLCTHRWNDLLDVCNEAYVDGHVEAVPGENLTVKYGYGSSPTGYWIWR